MTFLWLVSAVWAQAVPALCLAEREELAQAREDYAATPVQCNDGTGSAICTCALDDFEGCCAGHNGVRGTGCYEPPTTKHAECDEGYDGPVRRTVYRQEDIVAQIAARGPAKVSAPSERARGLTVTCYVRLGWDVKARRASWDADVAAVDAILRSGGTEAQVLDAVRAAPQGASLLVDVLGTLAR